jgi:hypothetical protein
MKQLAMPVLAATGLFLTGPSGTAATLTLNPSADSTVWQRAGNAAWLGQESGAFEHVDFYSYSTGADLNAFGYFQFDLSALSGLTINSVTLTLTKVTANTDNEGFGTHSTRNDSLNTDRVRLYGLTDAVGNTAQNWTEGLSYTTAGAELDQAGNVNFATDPFDVTNGRAVDFSTLETISGGTVITLAHASVNSFVQGRVNADGYVTFLLDMNASGRGTAVYSSEAAANQPVLSIDYNPVPEPSTVALAGLGLLAFGSKLRRRG